MIRALVFLAVLSGIVCSISCSTQERLAADTIECHWIPWSERSDEVYENIESKMTERNIPIANVDAQYMYLSGLIDYCRQPS